MSKTEADDLKKISTKFLGEHGYFRSSLSGTITWTRNGAWGEQKNSVSVQSLLFQEKPELRIVYTQTDRDTDEKKDFDYRIPLVSTPCNFGGVRYWFICPWYKDGIYCGRRIGTLYKDGDYFACRHCYELTYHSKNIDRCTKWYAHFRYLDLFQKAEAMEEQIKRRYYRGKLTRKQRQLDKLYARFPRLTI